METIINLNDFTFLSTSRDDFLMHVSENICKTCTSGQKKNFIINYDNPLQCECQCKHVEKLLLVASDLDEAINLLKNNH